MLLLTGRNIPYGMHPFRANAGSSARNLKANQIVAHDWPDDTTGARLKIR